MRQIGSISKALSSRTCSDLPLTSRIGLVASPAIWSSRLLHTTPASRRPESSASASSIPTSKPVTNSSSTATSTTNVQEPTPKSVGYHSIFLALLVYAIILVGGLTRLTESGLSITEWNPGFKGMWLPSTDEEWEGEWAKYRETPEFVLLNSKMNLEDFKSIYMWEWSHRIIGRLIGVAYVLPALYFVARGLVKPPFRSKLFLIGLGIGAQGAMGWYMVKSGLTSPEGTLHVDPNDEPHSGALAPTPASTPASWTPRVSHFRLAAHLGLAFLVYAGMLRTGLSVFREYNLAKNVGKASGLKTGPGVREHLISILSKPQVARYRGVVGAVTGLVFLTAMSGAFVAGLDAGLVYNEFPTMGDGRIAPPLSEMFDERYARTSSDDKTKEPSSIILSNLTQNPVTVQFIHRCLAVTTFAVVAGLTWRTHRLNRALKATGAGPLPPAVPRLANAALAAVTLQASLGISTLVYMVPIELASAHQAGSVLLLSVMLALWGTLRVPTARGIAGAAQQIANVAAASSGSAVATSAAGGAPGMARAIHTSISRGVPSSRQRASLKLHDLPDKVMLKTGPTGR